MARGGTQITARNPGSNRAPCYSDAVVDSTLLAAAGKKTVTPAYVGAVPTVGIASGVAIWNSSGQAVTIAFQAARNPDGSLVEGATSPLYLANGDTLPFFTAPIMAIIETNVGVGTQTGRGVRYFFEMESTT